jgi:hypothetical protein
MVGQVHVNANTRSDNKAPIDRLASLRPSLTSYQQLGEPKCWNVGASMISMRLISTVKTIVVKPWANKESCKTGILIANKMPA